MFCYYNFVIVFGGQASNQDILSDLWVFDVVKEDWHHIMDTSNAHELEHKKIFGDVPEGRVFSGGNVVPRYAAGYFTGGWTNEGVACDMWSINMEKLVSFVENPTENKIKNVFKKHQLKTNEIPNLCRWGHASTTLDHNHMFVYGGVDQEQQAVQSSFTVLLAKDRGAGVVDTNFTEKLNLLTELEVPPATRIKFGILSTGGGMMILYGGMNPEGNKYFSDLWHLFIDIKNHQIRFKKISYKSDHYHLLLSWRYGFTMHNVYGFFDPVLVGGSFGNGQ